MIFLCFTIQVNAKPGMITTLLYTFVHHLMNNHLKWAMKVGACSQDIGLLISIQNYNPQYDYDSVEIR